MLEINILLYKGTINEDWINALLNSRDDITVNIYLYKEKYVSSNRNINIIYIPKSIKTYGEAYNYIISNVKCKYFILLDNLDYLDTKLFNKTITKEILSNNYDMIKSNHFYVREGNDLLDSYDDYNGTNIEIEDKIMNRSIYPYFFGCRIYNTKLIIENNIRFNNTDIYNDVYPNILLARNLDMDNVLIVDFPFYIRYRLSWDSKNYNKNDLKEMVESLIKINVPKEKILIRLVDSYNYSVNIRACDNKLFIEVVKEFFDINDFFKLANERNKREIYYKKKQSKIIN